MISEPNPNSKVKQDSHAQIAENGQKPQNMQMPELLQKRLHCLLKERLRKWRNKYDIHIILLYEEKKPRSNLLYNEIMITRQGFSHIHWKQKEAAADINWNNALGL